MYRLLRVKSSFVFFLSLCGAILYIGNLEAPFVYDDFRQIVRNTKLKDPSEIVDASFTDTHQNRPLQNLTFAINWAISPNSRFSFHLFNNALHILNSAILFLFLSSFVKRQYLPQLASFFFLVHPLQVQSVTYIMGRISLLQTFITLLILLVFSNLEARTPWLISCEERPRLSC